MRHGPHQLAQKSIRTGLSDFKTADWKFCWSTVRILLLAIAVFPFC